MRVLVTGGSGFIGSRVAAALHERGHQVTALGRTPVVDAAWSTAVHDLRHSTGLESIVDGSDAVVHCAASLHGDAEAQLAVTVNGTTNLLAAMRATGVTRLVLLSSYAVYDYRALAAGELLTEDAPLEGNDAPRGPYVTAKLEQESLVRSGGALEWTIVRPALVYGPGRTWFYHLGMQLGGRLWVTLAGQGLLPLNHVDNCASAIALATELPSAVGQVLNLVDDDLPTRAAYVARLAAYEATRPRVVNVPWAWLNTAAGSAWLGTHHVLRDMVTVPGILHPSVLSARCKPLRYSNHHAKVVLGWRPQVDPAQGIRQALGARTA